MHTLRRGMKFIKKLFSRTALTLLAILLQVLIYTYIFGWLATSYLYVSLAFTVIGVFFVIIVINRDMSASYKVPWIVVLLAMPIMGVVIYLLFGYPRLRRSQKKRFVKVLEETKKYGVLRDETMNALSGEDQIAATQAQYLFNATRMPLWRGCDTEYFASGEEAFVRLKERLKEAKKFIFMEYFIIEDGKMWGEILDILLERHLAGVEVKVMYDDFGCSGRIKHNYCDVLTEKGIDCVKFNKLTPLVTAIHNNRDHRKITVIDGEVAFTGGYNLCDEYINVTSPFGYWKDSGVMLKGEAVMNFTLMFLRQFAVWSGQTIDFDKYLSVSPNRREDGYVLPFGDGPAPIYNDTVGEEAYLNVINQAKRYVYITTPYLIVDYHITKALKAAAKRGVDVRIITPGIPDKKLVNIMTKSSYYGLIKDGVKIYEFVPGFIHAKSFVADDSIGIVGTINLDYRSLVHHFECAVWMYKTRAVSQMKVDFDNTLYKCRSIDAKTARLKWYQKLASSVLMLFAPLM